MITQETKDKLRSMPRKELLELYEKVKALKKAKKKNKPAKTSPK